MLRRVLPVAAAAAALLAVPSTAFATAPQAPVENIFAAGYYGYTDFVLPDGRHVSAGLSNYRGASQNGWSADLSLSVTSESCPEAGPCRETYAWGDATLTEAQVAFSRNLDGASAVDVPMTMFTPSSSSDFLAPPDSEQVTVSITFSGTGAITRDSYRGELCGDGSRVCQSHRIGADRDATVEVALDGQNFSGPGHLSYSLATDTAAPKFGPEGP